MFTAKVGHGHAVAACGNACASAARASVPSAPPVKIAATVCQSGRGSTSLDPRGSGAARPAAALLDVAVNAPGPGAAGLDADGSGKRYDSSVTPIETRSHQPRPSASPGAAVREASPPRQGIIWPFPILAAPTRCAPAPSPRPAIRRPAGVTLYRVARRADRVIS